MVHSLKNKEIIIGFFSLILVLSFTTNFTLLDDHLYFNFYSNSTLSYETINKIIEEQKKWQWVGYILLPAFYFAKFLLVTCILLMGIFILGLRCKFRQVLKIVILSEFIFLLPLIIIFVWFGFIHRDYDLIELMTFAPLSLDNLIDSSGTPWLTPTLKSLNLFELAYWLLLSYGLMNVIKRSFNQSLGLVIASYGSAFIVWQVFLIFLSINLAT